MISNVEDVKKTMYALSVCLKLTIFGIVRYLVKFWKFPLQSEAISPPQIELRLRVEVKIRYVSIVGRLRLGGNRWGNPAYWP